MSYVIRTATRQEMDTAIEWAAKEGWNPGLYDADAFYAADSGGFFMGIADGEPVSVISAVSYGPAFGFLGLYIVKQEHRGKGYGWAIWQEALRHLPTQNIGLDGVVEAQHLYKKSGFRLVYRNVRYEGRGTDTKYTDTHIVPLDRVPFDQLLTYDQTVFLFPRKEFLSLWIKQPESLAVGYIDRDVLKGYGVIRPCRTGFKIGPLFADAPEVAEAILTSLLSFAGAQMPVFFDIPETNPDAVRMVEKRGWKPMFETARMYTKAFPDIPLRKVFGVTTFEAG